LQLEFAVGKIHVGTVISSIPSVFVLLVDGKRVVAVPSTEGREGGFACKLVTLEKALTLDESS
jgi:hypothetical protein